MSIIASAPLVTGGIVIFLACRKSKEHENIPAVVIKQRRARNHKIKNWILGIVGLVVVTGLITLFEVWRSILFFGSIGIDGAPPFLYF